MKHPSDWTDTQRKRFLILVGLLLVAALFLVGWLVGEPMLRLASDPEAFRQWIAERQTSGLLLYGGMVCFQVFFAIIPGGNPLENLPADTLLARFGAPSPVWPPPL